MAATRLLEVPGVAAIDADEHRAELRINGCDEHLKLAIPVSPAEARELASNLLRWADAVEPPQRVPTAD